MRTVYKYPLKIEDTQVLYLPRGATILTVMVQDGQLCVWAEVDRDRERCPWVFMIVGTGNPKDEDTPVYYIGSVQMPPFVWHVYANEQEGISV